MFAGFNLGWWLHPVIFGCQYGSSKTICHNWWLSLEYLRISVFLQVSSFQLVSGNDDLIQLSIAS